MSFEFDPDSFHNDQASDINIKVVGVGSFGSSSLNYMIEKKIAKVTCITVHSDPQALKESKAPVKVLVGNQFMNEKDSKKNLSSGSWKRFSIGDDDRQNIAKQLQGADMIILVAGMGKGTSTTLTPAVALLAKNMGILTVGLVTLPFACEGKAKVIAAAEGITELRKYVDTLIVLDSDRICSSAATGTTVSDAFCLPYEVVHRAIKGMTDVLTHKGHIKVSFDDVAELLSDAGDAVIATASAFGDGRALQAVMEALKSLQAESESIDHAKGVLVNITGEVTMKDLSEAMAYLEQEVGSDTQIINGYIEESTDTGETRALLIATGLARKLHVQPMYGITKAGKDFFPERPVVPNPNKETDYKVPAYIRRKIYIKALDENPLLNGSFLLRKDRINKIRPDEPAFLRLISDN
ncbi:MAG: cell division protein FtsZ [Chlorobiaceae bacterium]